MATNGEATYDFKPIDYDINALPPIAAVGKYQAKIEEVKLSKTQGDGYPMLVVDWSILEVLEDGDPESVGLTATDFLVFFPEREAKGRFSKQKMRALLESAGIDFNLVPTRIQTREDFTDLMGALRGATAPIWISHKERNGETNANVNYTAPKGGGGGSSAGALPMDDEDEAPKAKKPAAKDTKKKR